MTRDRYAEHRVRHVGPLSNRVEKRAFPRDTALDPAVTEFTLPADAGNVPGYIVGVPAKRETAPKNPVLAYIQKAPPDARRMLRQFHEAIRAAAPRAEEKLSYGMPYYSHHGRLIYFSAFRNHVSLFVMADARKRYGKEIKRYQAAKATLRFPIGTRVPVALVKKLVKVQAKANESRR